MLKSTFPKAKDVRNGYAEYIRLGFLDFCFKVEVVAGSQFKGSYRTDEEAETAGKYGTMQGGTATSIGGTHAGAVNSVAGSYISTKGSIGVGGGTKANIVFGHQWQIQDEGAAATSLVGT